jgi:hypothetical protein
VFKHLKIKTTPHVPVVDSGTLSAQQMLDNPATPITIRDINNLPDNAKRRIYRNLIPPGVLAQFDIDPISWQGPTGESHIRLIAEPDSGSLHLGAKLTLDSTDEFFTIELTDNAINGIDLNLLLLNDPHSPRFKTDYDADGQPTMLGTARRNLKEEERALQAGLAPAQFRSSLGASKIVLQQIENFLTTLSHDSYFLEPLTYVSAWVFEQRGFAYMRGHKLMDGIHREFQPGGKLHAALDSSTPFRQPDQWNSVRGRAWAIHDGILEAIGTAWNELRMIKRVGHAAGVNTFPGAKY